MTSPPYWMQRQYLPEDHPNKHLELGRETTPEAYIAALVAVFQGVPDALADDGTLWINIGTCYARRSSSGSLVGSSLEGSQRAQLAYRGARPGKTASVRATQRGLQGRVCGVPDGWADKELIPLAWMLGLALHADGWLLRMDNIWAPASAMPESVKDRPTHAHEYVLLLTKTPRYFYNAAAIRQPMRTALKDRRGKHIIHRTRPGQPPQTHSTLDQWDKAGRNCRSVWDDINTEQTDGDHVAPMPRALARRCILAGSAAGDHVLDPFGGSGTVGAVAAEEGRHATLIDLDERAIEIATQRTAQGGLAPLNEVRS